MSARRPVFDEDSTDDGLDEGLWVLREAEMGHGQTTLRRLRRPTRLGGAARTPSRLAVLGAVAGVVALNCVVVGSLVLALRAAQTEGDRPVDEAEVVEFARTTLVDLLSYTPDDTRRVESALARLCPDSPEAGSARGLVEQLRRSAATSEVRDSSVGRVVARTPDGDLVVSIRVVVVKGAFGVRAERTDHDRVTVRPEPRMCVQRFEVAR
ncbi:hypothetical protein [Gordonia paraffinivorans]|uniref:hypothetical protein n=2 Tax=Gordonia paraffinivorans TaxID=175628 RepID=UPI001B3697BC|nr:hypothetical protein [Gordonia paraffinivorans]